MISLGQTARDKISGVTGIVIAITHWHDRSSEVALLREGCDADGKPFEPLWVPIERVVA